MKFRNKQHLTDWANEQFEKHDVRKPDSYTAEELIRLNPAVPQDFIRAHVVARDK